MVRRRVYRHNVRCPDCGSNWMRLDGFSNGRPAYSCGDCRRRYVPDGAYRRPGPAVKAQAIAMYIEGSSLSAIGRVLGYSAPAVFGVGQKKGAAYSESAAGTERTADGRRGGATAGAAGNGGVRLYDRLPAAAVYRWFLQDRRCVGKCGAVNWTKGCIRRCGAS